MTLGKMLHLSEPPQTRRSLRFRLTWALWSLRHGLCRLVMSRHGFLAPRNTRRLYWALVGTTFIRLLPTGSLCEGGATSLLCSHPCCLARWWGFSEVRLPSPHRRAWHREPMTALELYNGG